MVAKPRSMQNTVKKGQIKIICSLTLLTLLLLSINTLGQKPYFRNIKLPDEIQQTSVSCLYQDYNHYLWVGTGKGLYCFDGNGFVSFAGDERNHSLQVSALHMTADQTLWVGTRKGDIYLLKGDSIQLFNPQEGNPKVAITGFATDKDGKLWFSTYGEGIYCFDGKQITNIDTDDGLTDNYCYTLTIDLYGRVWAATDGGISVCSIINSMKEVRKITMTEGLPDNIVLSLLPDKTGIWAGMQDAGICLVDTKTLNISPPALSNKWNSGPVNHMVLGNYWLWLSTERNGIICVEPSSGNIIGNYTNTDNQNLSRINGLYADKQGNYWVVSSNQLYLSLGNNLLYFNNLSATEGKSIHSVLADSKGYTWFSNDDGLYRLDPRHGAMLKIDLPLKKNMQIISLFEDTNGFIWAGTFGNGLFCIHPDGRRYKLFNEADGLANGNILSIAGKGSQLWLATLGGAYKCEIKGDPLSITNKVSFTNFNDQNFPGNNYIYSVFIDSRNRIWFGTDGKGISMLDEGRFTNFSKEQGLKSNIIYSITEDSGGDIWFSTSNAGLYRYNGKSFLNYTTADGLSDLHISALLADKNHHLLIVQNNGVDVLDTRKNTFLYFGADAGMPEINPDLNVCSLSGADVAWIGTQNGLIRMQVPKDINGYQPSLSLTKISVLLGNENHLGKHDFAYNTNHISFHYNALWFLSPSLVKYQVRLKGYDLDWNETRNNLATYSNLPPGKYTFEVRSAIKGDFSQSAVISYPFVVQRPFWKTNWFIIAVILGLSALVYLIIYLREKAVKKRDALEREKIMFQFQTLRSQVNPHFLFNSFSTLISIIDEDKDVAIDYVEKLSLFFRSILDYRDTDLIPLNDELKLTDTYYYLQKKRYCQNLNLEIEVNDEHIDTLIPPMVLQMLVENAIKHNVVSAEKKLNVRIATGEGYIKVTNTLQLKKGEGPSTGIGLANIQNRYKLLGFGQIIISETNDEFCVKLPLIFPSK